MKPRPRHLLWVLLVLAGLWLGIATLQLQARVGGLEAAPKCIPVPHDLKKHVPGWWRA